VRPQDSRRARLRWPESKTVRRWDGQIARWPDCKAAGGGIARSQDHQTTRWQAAGWEMQGGQIARQQDHQTARPQGGRWQDGRREAAR